MYEARVGSLSVLVGGERAEDTRLRLFSSDMICDVSLMHCQCNVLFCESRQLILVQFSIVYQ